MDATVWDERYRATSGLVWGDPPNRFVEQELRDVPPGTALDLACGEGRNARWLAGRGWTVTAVDFSLVAVEKARAVEPPPGAPPVAWVCDDVLRFRAPEPVDLVLLCYLQLPPAERRQALAAAAEQLAPGGLLLVIGHASRNLTEGAGGPQDPAVLYSPDDVASDLAGTGLVVERAEEVLREVADAPRPAIDTLVRASRPAAVPGEVSAAGR